MTYPHWHFIVKRMCQRLFLNSYIIRLFFCQHNLDAFALGLKGSYDYKSYQQSIEQLQDWLAQHSEYTVVGPPRRFFYDAPYIPEPLKRSEIQVPIRLKND